METGWNKLQLGIATIRGLKSWNKLQSSWDKATSLIFLDGIWSVYERLGGMSSIGKRWTGLCNMSWLVIKKSKLKKMHCVFSTCLYTGRSFSHP